MSSASKGVFVLVCLAFVAAGLPFLTYAGAQYDEVFFYNALHDSGHVEYAMKFGSVKLPIMLFTYIGTLKAAIYAPLLHWFGASEFVLRIPVLVFGALSVGLFFLMMLRLAGHWSAVLVSLLLATDAVYVLTCVFDWGPVALQHLLGGGAFYCMVRYAQERKSVWLFAGSVLAGLALWDKALFAWHLGGFGLAALIVYRKELVSIARRHWALALAGFVVGAAPLLYYNKLHRLRTFESNVRVEEQGVETKLRAMATTMDGSALFGYLVREDAKGRPADMTNWEKIPLAFNDTLGGHRSSGQLVLLWSALLLSPVLCWFGPLRRRVVFFWIGGGITHALMLLTRGAGGSAHHTILLWPVPQILLGLLLAQTARLWPKHGSWAGAVVVLVGVTCNLAVLNTYLAHFIEYGPGPVWTDAIRPLVREITSRPEREVFAVDWGITQQIEYYGEGRLGVEHGSDGIVKRLPQPDAMAALERSLADPAKLFVMHAEGYETFHGVRRKLLALAAERGYRDSIVQTIQDRHGATVFELHEFRK